MSYPKFYVGQRVVAIEDHCDGAFKKGQQFQVTSVAKGCHTYSITIGITGEGMSWCRKCQKINKSSNQEVPYSEQMFAPIIEDFKKITFEKIVEQEPVGVN